jgi:hypothetical protein
LLKQRWSRQLTLLLLNCATLALCLTSPSHSAAQPVPPITNLKALFDFHSNFWVNLHQVLFHEALLRAGKPNRQLQNTPPLSAAAISEQDQITWNAAVSFYAAHLGTRPQHGDDELIQINDELAEQPDNGANPKLNGLPPEIAAVLQSAAVIYRKYWWPQHNKSNENWLASQKDRLQQLGPKLATAMTKDLHQPWPATPIRVDVCFYVVALGYAFTTTHPSHTTFSSSDPTTQDLSGFELLFHEASHTFADTLMNAFSAEGGRQHKEVGDLWHSVLFYTSGVELRRLLPASEQASFAPYAYRYGVYNGGWAKYRGLLETHWQAYLNGKVDFTDTIHSMVAALP